MAVHVIVGGQWGDEGKGTTVDMLSQYFDIVARWGGGPNAGHSVEVGEKRFVLHGIPVGILRPNKKCLMGNGTVIDPIALLEEEIADLEKEKVEVMGRLFFSKLAHLILPYHKILDKVVDKAKGKKKVGTTGKGIGPAYVDKYNRCGIRIVDLLNMPTLETKLSINIEEKKKLLHDIYGYKKEEGLEIKPIIEQLMAFKEALGKYFIDVSQYLNEAIKANHKILAEGAQGTMLDIDFGSYPFVTSSNPVAGGACAGLGIGPTHITEVQAIIKAYTTRVGEGPLPTEFAEGMFLNSFRRLSNEYGATTGRPRRCGWFDVPVVMNTIESSGVDSLALTKLDILDNMNKIQICTTYNYESEILTKFPSESWKQKAVTPNYITIPGWNSPTRDIREFDSLPFNARKYISKIEELTGVPIDIISVGPDRKEFIIRKRIF